MSEVDLLKQFDDLAKQFTIKGVKIIETHLYETQRKLFIQAIRQTRQETLKEVEKKLYGIPMPDETAKLITDIINKQSIERRNNATTNTQNEN